MAIIGDEHDNSDQKGEHGYFVVDRARTPEKYRQTIYLFMDMKQMRELLEHLSAQVMKPGPHDTVTPRLLKIFTGMS